MAVELIVLGLLFFFVISSLLFGFFTEQKIFLLGSFLLLMFAGILVQSSGGIIVGHYYSPEAVLLNITVDMTDSILYLFSQACFWVGLVLSAWIGLVAAFGSNKTSAGSPFNW